MQYLLQGILNLWFPTGTD